MKKICIVTICNGSNFGNRLQNYALQETLESRFECRVMTARNLSGEIGRQLLRFAPLHAFLRSGFAQAAASTVSALHSVRSPIPPAAMTAFAFPQGTTFRCAL